MESGQTNPNHSQTGFPPEEFIDKREVGRRLRVALRTVEVWMRQGILPYYKVGNMVRFKWSEIECHLSQHCRISYAGPKSRAASDPALEVAR